ncbi:serine/threonine protein kinase [[Emmonsia] crescens]|uniref:Serine/threonine protein kinase n=1 Tax=[Emmonsia] crescens TaxID=73230 RepID=A0A2B7ZRA8_9EURO|nr:serine/threonine protein kinase [Emmonsia crescens]
MASALHRVFKGAKGSYKLIEVLKEPVAYKAAIIPSSSWSGASTDNAVVKDLVLERELDAHELPTIKASPWIRQAIDVIEKGEHEDWSPSQPSVNKRLVLEWMDTDLWHARPYGKPFSNPKLPQIVARSVLEALCVFHGMRGVHTDVNPNNIFLSGLETPTPKVKLGDLDNGVGKNNQVAQTNETRAPEVWQGLGVWHPSDIWSLGVTLTHWLISGGLFGPTDKIVRGHQTAWCLAKITRLIGPVPMPENPDYKEDFELGAGLELGAYKHPKTGEQTPYITVGSLRQELQKLPSEICSEACIDFIEHLLVIDTFKRPSAEKALSHPFVSSVII